MLHIRTTRRIGRLSLTLILILTAMVSALAQTATSSPARENNEAKPTEQTSSDAGDKTTDQKTPMTSASAAQDTTTTATTKKPKRGQLIVAPIPITSPAVGRGLVLAVGYVFKLNQEDKKSPPSTVGLIGAFTSSGTRGGGLGGRLYFSENKYQTTFVIAKGRVDVDFFGIGRIPGKEAI